MMVTHRRILSPLDDRHKDPIDKGLRIDDADMTAQGQRAARKPSPDLARVIDAWPVRPEAIRAGIVAMVRACEGSANRRPRRARVSGSGSVLADIRYLARKALSNP